MATVDSTVFAELQDKFERMEDVLTTLIENIEATGGVVTDEHGNTSPVAYPGDHAQGAVYLEACDALDMEPMEASI